MPHFEKLVKDRRVSRARAGDRSWWVPAERARTFARLMPDAELETEPPAVEANSPSAEEAAIRILAG